MSEIKTQVVVLGAGPGGYTAAFRAADLGLDVVLVERYPTLGGVCLNVGCIPSKTLLHAAKVIDEAEMFSSHGISFGKPKIDIDKVRAWKESVIKKLTGGLAMLAKQRKVKVVTGLGSFTGANTLSVKSDKEETTINFDHAIIAAGSQPVKLPFMPDDPRVMDSTGALELNDVPGKLLVLGGGIIGCEMATVYEALGSKISIVEFMDQLMPGVDKDIIKPYQKRVEKRYESIMLKTKVVSAEAKKDGIHVTFEGENAPTKPVKYDRVLMSVGRTPNGGLIGAEHAGVKVDERGFIPVDNQCRTNVPHIFAIGDIIGQPMLAHKALHEAKVAAEVIAGEKVYFMPKTIPNVAYTDPEIAWAGLTEDEAKAQGINYEKAVFPWAANGRSLSQGRDEGMTKLLFDPETDRLLGGTIIGTSAGDLICEVVLALEMGCEASDIALSIHPHPTFGETTAAATEAFEGTLTDLYMPKKKKAQAA